MGWTKFFWTNRDPLFPSPMASLEFYDPAFINSLKKEKDYIDIEGHVVPDVEELTNGRTLDEDLP